MYVCSQIALLDSPTALSMEEKLHQNEARVSLSVCLSVHLSSALWWWHMRSVKPLMFSLSGVQVLELTKEWTNKWNETQNILKVRLSDL